MWWVILAVVLGGAAISVQAPINAALSRELGAAVPAAAVSFGVGFLVLLAIAAFQGQGGAFLKLPQVPAWTLVGGVLGAWYVFATVWGVASLGVVTLVAALILGQMAAAMVIDATGALGMAVREVTPTRLAAAALVAAGLLLSRL
ncbi:DMT family transporter [Tabrizicola sp.]|uniref:DMT family transporter n=1 Tax=Tabrizicola sp. TaxID=2005166 RepID=UPI0027364717|nr:DMT family transporter [Tabrizicola sp.]MDP3194097.1 DMT family transporter [Tabrizicola sp.]MDZ4088534.1 DMT family transporter [Tabrizicola sp.]